MKKTLRFSLLSMLLMLCGTAMAQTEVTIDFDNDYQTLFPTLPGVSSSANSTTGAEASSDGDFTGTTTSTAVSGVTVTIAPAEDAKTPSRIWSAAPRLRMYSGSFTVTSSTENITKIEFTGHNTNFNITTTTGTLNGKTWAGEAKEIEFAVSKNTQINKIVVTLGGEPGTVTPDDPKPVEGLSTCADVIAGTDGTVYRVKGTCTEIKNTTYGNWNLQDETGQIYIYGTLDAEGKTKNFTSLGIEVGDIVTVEGPKKLYGETVELVDVTVINIEKGTVTPPEPADEITVAKALEIIAGLNDGQTTTDIYKVKGFIVGTPDFQRNASGALYGNVNLEIADEKGGSPTLTIFRAKSFDNESFTEETILNTIKEGDEVVFEGKLQKYVKGEDMTPELTSGKLISVNGKTAPVVEPTVKEVSVEQALDVINDDLSDGQTTSDLYRVTGFIVGAPDFQRNASGALYGNVNLEIADEKGGSPTLTVFRGKSFDGESFTEETISLLKEGDEVVFEGKLQRYVSSAGDMTPELKEAKLLSVNGGTSFINDVQRSASSVQVYNLQGQRVAQPQRGFYIIDGRKVIVK